MAILDNDLLAVERMRGWTLTTPPPVHLAIVDRTGRELGAVTSPDRTNAFRGARRMTIMDHQLGAIGFMVHDKTVMVNTFDLFDPSGRLVGTIEQKVGGRLIGTFGGPSLIVHLPGGLELTARGGTMVRATVLAGSVPVAAVGDRWPTPQPDANVRAPANSYVVAFNPGTPPLQRIGALCAALALDILRAKDD